jgi:hypothetical protein
MHNMVRIFAFVLVATLCAPVNAATSDDGYITYVVKHGDTLIDMGKRYLNTPNSYRIVQQQNNIRDARALPVGKPIRIARNLLKYQTATAKLISVRGNVLVGSSAASAGQSVSEGATLKTAGSSFVTLSLPNGSRVSLPSNSDLRIRLLRTYSLGGALDYDFDVTKGGASTSVTPLKSADDRYRVRTPRAVSAVRGTDFQVRYDDKTDRDFAEVIEGGLAVSIGANADTALPAGNGMAVPQSGAAIKEALLPEPKLIEPGKIQADSELLFTVDPRANETGYRLTWATDAGFVEQVADMTISGQEAKLAGIGDGNYFVRARAISENGIQGVPVTYAFKRRLNGVKASAGASNDGYSFKWQSDGQGVRKFHFQLFNGEPNGVAMVDEPALADPQIIISDLPPGNYFWRVGAVQFADGEVATNWTSFEKLAVAP